MKAKRKHHFARRRVGLMIHAALFLMGSTVYFVWWLTTFSATLTGNATNPGAFGALLLFLITWLVGLGIHALSVPFYQWAHMGQSLWWRSPQYQYHHWLLDANVALFMATTGGLVAYLASTMQLAATVPLAAQSLLFLLPFWFIGVLVHGHRVLVRDIEASHHPQSAIDTSRLEDQSDTSDDQPLAAKSTPQPQEHVQR